MSDSLRLSPLDAFYRRYGARLTPLAIVKSVQAAIYMPVAEKIAEVNAELESQPQLVNTDSELNGRLMRILPENSDDVVALMDLDAYLNTI